MAQRRGQLSSCFECAALAHCYGTKQPALSRVEAWERASRCGSVRKGRTTDVIPVVGRSNGMSRKKAEGLVAKGRAVFQEDGSLRLNEAEGGKGYGSQDHG